MNGAEPFKYYTDWHGNNLRDEKQMVPFPRTPAGVRDVRSRYYGTITHDDDQIGRILDKLDEKQLTEDTLVIFLADHGISLGAHGISGKQTMYEEGIRLPLVMRYPRLRRGSAENPNLVSLIDIFPTICEVAGITIPDSIEGKSLLGPYQSKGPWHREGPRKAGTQRIFASFVSPTRHRLNIRCIRTERYKLIHHLTTDETELYDLEKDPYELNNLARPACQGPVGARQKRSSKLKKRLAAELLAWRTKAESKETRGPGYQETRVSGNQETRERRDLA